MRRPARASLSFEIPASARTRGSPRSSSGSACTTDKPHARICRCVEPLSAGATEVGRIERPRSERLIQTFPPRDEIPGGELRIGQNPEQVTAGLQGWTKMDVTPAQSKFAGRLRLVTPCHGSEGGAAAHSRRSARQPDCQDGCLMPREAG